MNNKNNGSVIRRISLRYIQDWRVTKELLNNKQKRLTVQRKSTENGIKDWVSSGEAGREREAGKRSKKLINLPSLLLRVTSLSCFSPESVWKRVTFLQTQWFNWTIPPTVSETHEEAKAYYFLSSSPPSLTQSFHLWLIFCLRFLRKTSCHWFSCMTNLPPLFLSFDSFAKIESRFSCMTWLESFCREFASSLWSS